MNGQIRDIDMIRVNAVDSEGVEYFKLFDPYDNYNYYITEWLEKFNLTEVSRKETTIQKFRRN